MTILKSVKEIQSYQLGAQDGKIGRCNSFLFDDKSWAIRYIVGDTHKWLPGRKVLISPISIGDVQEATSTLSIDLTKDQIKDSPPLDSDAPVSRQYEILFNRYHDWGNYWEGPLTWGHHPYPRLLERTEKLREQTAAVETQTHLRSTHEILGYSVKATDKSIGHIEDFIVDKETWVIRYLIVDTSNWLPSSRKVIIPPTWAERFDWSDRSIIMGVSSEKIKNSPEYDPKVILDRDYEKLLYDFYNLPYYW